MEVKPYLLAPVSLPLIAYDEHNSKAHNGTRRKERRLGTDPGCKDIIQPMYQCLKLVHIHLAYIQYGRIEFILL